METETIKYKFEDLQLTFIPPFRKNSRGKYKSEYVEVEDTLHPVEIQFGGKIYTLYVRGKDLKDTDTSVSLYKKDGTQAVGIWKHGWSGTVKHEGDLHIRYGKLVTSGTYMNGQRKDQQKYLLAIKDLTQ